jgi:hypothetical protein
MKIAGPRAHSTEPSLRAVSLGALAAVLVTAVAGCGSTTSTTESKPASTTPAGFREDQLPKELVSDLPLVAPKSDLDIPLFTGIVDVEPGADVTFCTFTDVILEEATIFGESFGAQSPQGHHGILQYTTTPQEPHTGSCGAMDGQMLLGGTGGKEVAQTQRLPENFGVEVPAGAQLVINHHWINASAKPVRGQTQMLARSLARGGDTVLAGNLPMVAFGWEIPPNGEYTTTSECKYGEDVPYVLALGHMHEWGHHVTIDVQRAAGGTETLIDEAWTPDSATTAGGGTIFSLENPFVIHKDDTVRLTCNWRNDTSEAIGFPREMCIFFGYTIGSSYFCANGTWLSADAVMPPGMGMGDIISHL